MPIRPISAMAHEPVARRDELLRDLRRLTPARVGLGRSGAGMPTDALLAFTLDHARARDAVHAAFDVAALMQGSARSVLSRRGPQPRRRPQGLSAASRSRANAGRGFATALAAHGGAPCRLAIVVGDGLSPAAVNGHAVELVRDLVPRLAADGIGIGCAVVASGARVALGDEIGALARRAACW